MSLLIRNTVYVIVSLLILNRGITYAQESDSSETNGISWFPIPFAFTLRKQSLHLEQ